MIDLLEVHHFTGSPPDAVRCAQCHAPISHTFGVRPDGARICAQCCKPAPMAAALLVVL
jgi:recombinational DNA repair protein (RecF pathway)